MNDAVKMHIDQARWFVTPAIIANAKRPMPCALLQTYNDEDGVTPLDHKIAYQVSDDFGKLKPRRRYVEPEHLFETEAAANEYIADQLARRVRAITRAYSRRTRPLRELTSEYEQKKKPLKALLQQAERRLHKPSSGATTWAKAA
ncbi:MAG: hypothetical protein ACRDAM_15990 [Casimicrobium sp.]